MKKVSVSIIALFSAASAFATCGALPSESVLTGLVRQAPGLHEGVLKLAMNAETCAVHQGLVKRPDLLTVIDYSIDSTQPRLFVFNLATHKLLFRELVAHGKNSGDKFTSFFSNDPGSEATSLGLFVTGDTYIGHNGYSLRLNGLEPGFNDMALARAIVLHGAQYVSQEAIRVLGRLGRSWGCPAVRADVAEKLIDTIRGGSAIFAYYPDQSWLTRSAFLH